MYVLILLRSYQLEYTLIIAKHVATYSKKLAKDACYIS